MIDKASPAMHLAIAKKYIERHNNLNYKEFIKGTLYPDVETNNIKLHYIILKVLLWVSLQLAFIIK